MKAYYVTVNIYRSSIHPTFEASTNRPIYNILLSYLIALLYRDLAFPNVGNSVSSALQLRVEWTTIRLPTTGHLHYPIW
jgi:hypothetical protein